MVFRAPHQLLHVLFSLALEICLLHLIDLFFDVHLFYNILPFVTLSLNGQIRCLAVMLSFTFLNSLLSLSQILLKPGQLISASPFRIKIIQYVLGKVKHCLIKFYHFLFVIARFRFTFSNIYKI